jgi:hypothetical protein
MAWLEMIVTARTASKVLLVFALVGTSTSRASECSSPSISSICAEASGRFVRYTTVELSDEEDWRHHTRLNLSTGQKTSEKQAGEGPPKRCSLLGPPLDLPRLGFSMRAVPDGKAQVNGTRAIYCPMRLELTRQGTRAAMVRVYPNCELFSERTRKLFVRAYALPGSGKVLLRVGVPRYIDEGWCGEEELHFIPGLVAPNAPPGPSKGEAESGITASLSVPFTLQKIDLGKVYRSIGDAQCKAGDREGSAYAYILAEDYGAKGPACPEPASSPTK